MPNSGQSGLLACFRLSLEEQTLRGWSAASDIGRIFDGALLTLEAYRSAEDRMVAVVLALHACAGGRPLVAQSVEPADGKIRPIGSPEAESLNAIIGAGKIPMRGDQINARADLDRISRLCLREIIWCRLVDEHGFFIEFGYDFIVFVGSSPPAEAAMEAARSARITVEPWQIPAPEGDD